MTRIVIADDHDVFRSTLRTALTGHEIAGEASNSGTTLELVNKSKPDLVLYDLSMGKQSIAQTIANIKTACEGIKVLVVTAQDNIKKVREAFEAGADGYFLKGDDLEELLSAIDGVMNGEIYVSPLLERKGSIVHKAESDC